MGIEHYYWIIDRAVVDPLLALSWPEFHRRYRWKGRGSQWATAAEFLAEFALDPQPDDLEVVHRILATRTLRSTMLLCSDMQYFFMLEVIGKVPEAERRCPTFAPRYVEECALPIAVAVQAYIDGKLHNRTLWASIALHGSVDEIAWLELSRKSRDTIVAALSPWKEPRPMFPWQSTDCLDGYTVLGLSDTRRFLRFLIRAWKEKWPAPNLGREARKELKLDRNRIPTLRLSQAFRSMVRHAQSDKIERPYLLRYFGP